MTSQVKTPVQTGEPLRTATDRPTFTVTLRPKPAIDGDAALRALLKRALRDYGLVCLGCRPAIATDAEIEAFEDAFERHRQAQEDRHLDEGAGS